MDEPFYIIATLYDDHCPPKNFNAVLTSYATDKERYGIEKDSDQGRHPAWPAGDTIAELAEWITYYLSDYPEAFSHLYFASSLGTFNGKHLFEVGCCTRPFTEEQYWELKRGITRHFTEEECDVFVERYHARFL